MVDATGAPQLVPPGEVLRERVTDRLETLTDLSLDHGTPPEQEECTQEGLTGM
jgi:hypothetical protein